MPHRSVVHLPGRRARRRHAHLFRQSSGAYDARPRAFVVLVIIAALGAALIVSDGIITPAITVLSAVSIWTSSPTREQQGRQRHATCSVRQLQLWATFVCRFGTPFPWSA